MFEGELQWGPGRYQALQEATFGAFRAIGRRTEQSDATRSGLLAILGLGTRSYYPEAHGPSNCYVFEVQNPGYEGPMSLWVGPDPRRAVP